MSFQKDIEAGTDLAASSETDRKKMLKYSEDWESYIDLLQFIHDRSVFMSQLGKTCVFTRPGYL